MASQAGVITSPSRPPSFPADKPQQQNQGDLADRWREIMGEKNWAGLLDPLDPLLRQELFKYGEFSMCTFEAFIYDPFARNYGVCKYQVWDFFDHMLMPKHAGYDVTKFIYCTSHNDRWPPLIAKPVNPRTWQQSNIWIGFIAVSNDETTKKLGRRDICVTWRGTGTALEMRNNLWNFLTPLPADEEYMPKPDPNIKVHVGFLSLYTHKDEGFSSARVLVLSEVKRLINQVYPNEEVSITVTGHSLGAALSQLSAYDIVETGVNVRDAGGAVPVSAIPYGGPRVGNSKFRERVDALGLKVLRIEVVHDVVSKVPGMLVNEKSPGWLLNILHVLRFPWAYTHVGVLLELNNHDSPYLKRPGEPHDLEGFMHLIDGFQGKGKKFELTTGRDIALVNKYSDFLLEEYLVPPKWREELNKSMVLNKDGKWVHKTTINSFQNN